LGRLTTVLEPNGSSQTPSMETDYGYDANNNLNSVTQLGAGSGSVGRSFAYDSLSRLIATTNPETSSSANPPSLACAGTTKGTAWTICFGYDADGNLISKTDNRNLTTTYGYDVLNRITSKSYSDGVTPSACYEYDNAATNGTGHLGVEWTQIGACPASGGPTGSVLTERSILAYDQMGRIWNEQQCVGSSCTAAVNVTPPCSGGGLTGPYYLPYCYDLAGNLTYSTNGLANTPGAGAPLTFTSGYDAAGRLNSVTSSWNDATHPSALFSSPLHFPAGALSSATYGTSIGLNRTYDNRLRITGESDTGTTVTGAAPGSATVTITGSEQSQ
jgi:YD repeat-containing protein